MSQIYVVPKNVTPLTGRLAVELSHLIGFESVVLKFPILRHDQDLKQDMKREPEDIVNSMRNSPGRAEDNSLYFILEERPGTYSIEKSSNIFKIGFSEISQFPEIWAECSKCLAELRKVKSSAVPDGFVAATVHAKAIAPFDRRDKKGLESLFEKDYILLDEDNDLLPDKLNAKILLDDDLSIHQLSAACSLAARLGMETTVAAYPITADKARDCNIFTFEKSNQCSVLLDTRTASSTFRLKGDGPEFEKFVAAVCNEFPLQKQGRRWVDLLDEMADAFAMQNLDGQLAWLEVIRSGTAMQADVTNQRRTTAYLSPDVHNLTQEIKKSYEPATLMGYKDLKKVEKRDFDLPWEVDVCKDLLNKKLWPQVKAGDRVKIYAVLSEDKSIRSELVQELSRLAAEHQAQVEDIRCICAYKQGFSWMEEEILPQIVGLNPDSLEIAFKPFLAPGVTEWKDEDGKAPTPTNVDTSDENKWYDLPIRYLQELYPIDDLLAKALNINRDNIKFVIYDGSEDITYEVRASSGGKNIFISTYKAYNDERCYIDMYPGMGKVHPATGHVTVWINGDIVVDERIRTDLEAVWDVFQQEILPWCKTFCDEKTNGAPTIADQPFFAQLRFDLELSEPDERLGIREDMISSLNSLHEEIYFVGTDFFKVYGNTTTGEVFDAPGLVLPDIRKRPGKPSMSVTLYDQYDISPFIEHNGEIIKPGFGKYDVNLIINELRWQDSGIVPVIDVSGSEMVGKVASAYANLLEKGWLGFNERLKGFENAGGLEGSERSGGYEGSEGLEEPKRSEKIAGIYLKFEPAKDSSTENSSAESGSIENSSAESGSVERYVSVKTSIEPKKDLDIRDIDLCEHELIGCEQYERIINELKRVPGIDVYPVAQTYLGRDIYAIELLPSYANPSYANPSYANPAGADPADADKIGYISRTKRLSNPSEIILGRHHANEVSSTNAMLMLLRELLTNPEFRNLADNVNIVMIPFENADGAAIHYELQKKNNPWWKFHIARFSAIGKEFYYEYFEDDTKHVEALAFTRLWRRWLPDAVIDNHGVPSHEWEQQFSGYTSPSFKGYWLPRSLLYNIFFTVNGNEYAGNIDVAKRIELDISNAVAADKEVSERNADWSDRWEKYAHGWLPLLFPADYFNDMISYWIGFDYDSGHRYPSVRYPWITTVAYIAEASDETAQDDYLHLCARTHMMHNLAIIRMLMKSGSAMKEEIKRDKDKVTSSRIRIRPMVI